MTTDQRLDRIERILTLFFNAGRRKRKKVREVDEKIAILIDLQIKNEDGFRELRERFKETDRKWQETDCKWQETARKSKETDRMIQETNLQIQETGLQMQETDRRMRETDRKWSEAVRELIRSVICFAKRTSALIAWTMLRSALIAN